MVGDLMKYGVQVTGKAEEEQSLLVSALYYLGPTLLIIGFWFLMMRQMQGGGKGGAFSFGKSRARLIDENNNAVTFADVAGCDEAKEEVFELVDFLKDPAKFQKLGGRIPRGVLLVGPPGTGKTLLAKAIAGEAKVPFFSISGSDFVEMFVGVGAARVRDMFENAKKQAPCIIFIDEIDAVGRHRGAGMGGGNDERGNHESDDGDSWHDVLLAQQLRNRTCIAHCAVGDVFDHVVGLREQLRCVVQLPDKGHAAGKCVIGGPTDPLQCRQHTIEQGHQHRHNDHDENDVPDTPKTHL